MISRLLPVYLSHNKRNHEEFGLDGRYGEIPCPYASRISNIRNSYTAFHDIRKIYVSCNGSKLAVTTFKFYLEFIGIGDHNLKYTPLGCSPLPARETSRRAVVTPMDP